MAGISAIFPYVYFTFLIFMVPSLMLSFYAFLIYRTISKIEGKVRVLVPPVLALVTAAIIPLIAIFHLDESFGMAVFGYLFTFVYGTVIASAIITPIFLFENKTTPRQRTRMILAFSAILAVLFARSFANVMGTPSPTVGLLGLVDYRSILKMSKPMFHFLSTILPYGEITCISVVFLCDIRSILFVNRKKKKLG